jgi:hypothetical protein
MSFTAENKGFFSDHDFLAEKLTTLSIGRPMPPNVRGEASNAFHNFKNLIS